MSCTVCMHPQRAQIENVILSLEKPKTEDLERIAKEYSVSPNDLKIHMVMHATLGVNLTEKPHETLARKCKIREADMLLEVANEYMVTLKSVGRRINKHANDADVKFEKVVTAPIANLYVGMGAEIRATVKAISELDRALNGPKEDSNNGLASLARALEQSRTAQGASK